MSKHLYRYSSWLFRTMPTYQTDDYILLKIKEKIQRKFKQHKTELNNIDTMTDRQTDRLRINIFLINFYCKQWRLCSFIWYVKKKEFLTAKIRIEGIFWANENGLLILIKIEKLFKVYGKFVDLKKAITRIKHKQKFSITSYVTNI